jgi:hypothetical protein
MDQNCFAPLSRDSSHSFSYFDVETLRHFRRVTHLEAKSEILRLFMKQKDCENLVVDDFANQFRHPAQGGIEVERGINDIRDFEQKRIDFGLNIAID